MDNNDFGHEAISMFFEGAPLLILVLMIAFGIGFTILTVSDSTIGNKIEAQFIEILVAGEDGFTYFYVEIEGREEPLLIRMKEPLTTLYTPLLVEDGIYEYHIKEAFGRRLTGRPIYVDLISMNTLTESY